MARNSSVGSPVVANTDQLLRLAQGLRAASPAAYRSYQRTVRVGAAKVLADAQSRASYSQKIPGSGRVRMLPNGNARVTFGGPSAPDAAPLENRGRGFVRHPLFGNRNFWYTTQLPAFLTPAFLENQPEIVQLMGSALVAAVEAAIDAKLGGL